MARCLKHRVQQTATEGCLHISLNLLFETWTQCPFWHKRCAFDSPYQKINKYKRKYRGNIFVVKFPRDFTDGNIPSVYTQGITVGKKIKTKQKKNDDVSFLPTKLPTESPTEFVPSVIPSVNLLVNCEHCSSY